VSLKEENREFWGEGKIANDHGEQGAGLRSPNTSKEEGGNERVIARGISPIPLKKKTTSRRP